MNNWNESNLITTESLLREVVEVLRDINASLLGIKRKVKRVAEQPSTEQYY